jgi:hypothetical protein
MHKRMLAVLLAGLLAGCATTEESAERPIVDGAAIARSVVPCDTTFAALRERLGEPSRDGRRGTDRIVTWVIDWDPLVRYLGVLLDADGRVVDVYWDIPSEVAWVPVDRCAAHGR